MIKILLLFFLVDPGMAKIHVQGHRGARAVVPENTMEGFQYALGLGVDVLELDLGVSKDRQVIIAHDPMVNTMLCDFDQKQVPLYTLTLAQIKGIDCGSKPNPQFPKQKKVVGARIPTLAELFQWIRKSSRHEARTVQFNIEIKTFPQDPHLTPAPKEFAQLVYDLIKQYDMIERTIVQSFDSRPLKAIKALDSRLRISFLCRWALPNLVAIAQELKAEFISPNKDWVTKKQVEDLRAHGIKTIPWTANTEKDWARLVQMGVDGIITDDPAKLISYLQEKKF